MQELISQRIKKMRQEISDISEANRRHVSKLDRAVAGDQERRLQRLQEILDELAALSDWKKV